MPTGEIVRAERQQRASRQSRHNSDPEVAAARLVDAHANLPSRPSAGGELRTPQPVPSASPAISGEGKAGKRPRRRWARPSDGHLVLPQMAGTPAASMSDASPASGAMGRLDCALPHVSTSTPSVARSASPMPPPVDVRAEARAELSRMECEAAESAAAAEVAAGGPGPSLPESSSGEYHSAEETAWVDDGGRDAAAANEMLFQ